MFLYVFSYIFSFFHDLPYNLNMTCASRAMSLQDISICIYLHIYLHATIYILFCNLYVPRRNLQWRRLEGSLLIRTTNCLTTTSSDTEKNAFRPQHFLECGALHELFSGLVSVGVFLVSTFATRSKSIPIIETSRQTYSHQTSKRKRTVFFLPDTVSMQTFFITDTVF